MRRINLNVKKNKAHICLVYQSEFPEIGEIRLFKIYNALIKNNFNVSILCKKINKQGKRLWFYSGRDIKLNDISSLCPSWILKEASPFNPFWTWAMLKLNKVSKIDLFIVRGMRLVLPTVAASRLLSCPVIADMSENFVGLAKLAKNYNKNLKWWQKQIRNRIFVRILEYFSVKLADFIWVVIDENKKRYISWGIPPNKIEVVSNVPEIEYSLDTENNEYDSNIFDKSEKLIYMGWISPERGLDIVIESMQFILKKIPSAELIIAGSDRGQGYLSDLKNLATKIGISDKIRFIDYSTPSDIKELIKNCCIGLVPHRINELTNTTIPNKLFDYMAAGIPVASTPMKPVERIIKETGAGIVIPCDPRGMAESLCALLIDKAKLKEMGMNARNAILKKYNWEIESKSLLQSITMLINK